MRKYFYCILILFTTILISSCKNNGVKEDSDLDNHAHHHGHENGTGHHLDDDEDAIMIEPEKAERLGIKTEVVEFAPFSEAIKVSAEVSAPPTARKTIVARNSGVLTLGKNITPGMKIASGQTIGTVNGAEVAGGDMNTAFKLEFETAKRELERMTPLFEQGIISAKEYNAAKLAYDKAKASLGESPAVSSGRVTSPDSGTLLSLLVNDGDFVEAGQAIGYVGDNAQMSLRADLPKRFHAKATSIVDAFIVPSCGDCLGFNISLVGGKRVEGNSAVTDKVSGFIPIYFTFNNNGLIESSGYIDAYLIGDSVKDALTVPESALSEQQGQWFVYVKLDDDCYEKKPVRKGGSNGTNVEILSGLQPGEEVVTSGVTFVKLSESADIVPEGHTHNH